MNLQFIAGTRPEFIKIGPCVAELRVAGLKPEVLATGQHTDLLRGTPMETDLADAISLGLESDGNVEQWLDRAVTVLSHRLSADHLVVVQGDTMSALAGARAADKRNLELCHIEAGIRSHTLSEPWPEEGARVEITQLADWHYAPTSTAYANLLAEGVEPARIRLTGNPVVSALARYSPACPRAPIAQVLITLHRREWRQGATFLASLEALSVAVMGEPKVQFLWPVHPGVLAMLPLAWRGNLPHNLQLVSPLPYARATTELAGSIGVLTDSGGLQEEAAALGVPCAVLRRVTDRPESIEAGLARRFDPTADGVHAAVRTLCSGMLPRRPSDCFGDVTAASQIARHLTSLTQRPGRFRE